MEIVIIALSTVLDSSFSIQVITVIIVAIVATIGVYGIVALIVRMDDIGLALIKKSNNKGILASFGQLLINLLPWVIKILSVVGTLALLMVSGGIFNHQIEYFHHLLPNLNTSIKEFILGLSVGLIVVGIIIPIEKLAKF